MFFSQGESVPAPKGLFKEIPISVFTPTQPLRQSLAKQWDVIYAIHIQLDCPGHPLIHSELKTTTTRPS